MPAKAANLAQNTYGTEFKVPQDRAYVAAVHTGHANSATAVFALMCAFEDSQRPSKGGTPVAISMWDGIAGAEVTSLTGSDKYGWADVPGAKYVYVVRTDGTGGEGDAAVDLVPAH